MFLRRHPCQVRRARAPGARPTSSAPVIERLEPRQLLSASDPFETVHFRGQPVLAGRGQWIVKFDQVRGGPHLQARRIESAIQRVNPELHVERHLGNTGLVLLRAPDELGLLSLRQLLRRAPGFQRIEPNAVLSAAALPDDTLFEDQYGLHNPGGAGKTADADIDAPEAWDITTGSSDVVVGLLDSGVDYTHPDIAANIFINPGEIPGDNLDNDNNGYIDDVRGWDFVQNDNTPQDGFKHGTHVTGILGAVGNNSTGISGVAWNVSILPLRILDNSGYGTVAGTVAAINYATMMRQKGINLRITNNSWGGTAFYQSIHNAVAAQLQADILVVAAAGNFYQNTDLLPYYPASFDLDGILSVGSTDANDALSSFSNFGGTTVDIMAPGSDIVSLVPGGITELMSGTSMATPVVSGIAALAFAVSGPSVTRTAIRNAILAGGDSIPALSGRSVTGKRANALQTLLQLPLQVLQSTPAPNDVLGAPPTSFTLNFSQSVDPASATPSDFLVNGIPADSLTWTSPREAVFEFLASPITAQGPQSLALSAGALLRTVDSASNVAFNATLYYDTFPMQVAGTLPAAGAVSPPLTSLDINFNEPVHAASLDAADLQLSRGQSTAVQLLDADTIRFLITGLDREGPVIWTLPKGAIADSFANASGPFSGAFDIDLTTTPWNSPWFTVAPAAAGAMTSSYTGTVNSSEDADTFTLNLDASQSLCVIVEGAGGLRPAVQLKDPSGSVLGQHTAAPGASTASLPTIQLPVGGIYSIVVSGDGVSSGAYTLRLSLNSTEELESISGISNDTEPQDLGSAFMPLPRGGHFATLRGKGEHPIGYLPGEIEPNDSQATANDASGSFTLQPTGIHQISIAGNIPQINDADFFNLGTLQPGDILTAAVYGVSTPRGSLFDPYIQLYRGTPGDSTIVDDNDDGGVDRDSLLYRFSIPVADNYYLCAKPYPNDPQNPAYIGTYDLAISLERNGAPPLTGGSSTVEIEPNSSLATAQNVASAWRPVTHVALTTGSLPDLDHDFLRYWLRAGDAISVRVTGQGSLKPRIDLLNAAGLILALDDGTSATNANTAAIYAWRVPADGFYTLDLYSAEGAGNYTARVELSSLAPPTPVPATMTDLYALPLLAGQSLQLHLDAPSSINSLEILGPAAQSLLAASGASARIDLASAPTDGTYVVRVQAAPDTSYVLSLARSATLETNDNHSLGTAQPMLNDALGHVDPYDPDVYSFHSDADRKLHLRGFVPFAGPGVPDNPLVLSIELYGPSNTLLAASSDASLNHTTATAGTYKLRVRSTSGAGAYRLHRADLTDGIPGTDANDTFHLRMDAGAQNLEVFHNTPLTAEPTYRLPASFLDALTISGGAGDDVLEIASTGLAVPLNFFAGAGQNQIAAAGHADLADASATNGQLDLIADTGADLMLHTPLPLRTLTLNAGAKVALAAGMPAPLEVDQITLDSAATLDLKDNDLLVHAANLDLAYDLITARLSAGRNTAPPLWLGPGIITTFATASTGLAVQKQSVAILVKYTWAGDANLDGIVNIDDYFQIDVGWALGRLGYCSGDFNYSFGPPTADDYFLIDQAFHTQDGVL